MRTSGTTATAAMDFARSSRFHAWPVRGERGLVGIVSRKVLEQAVADGPDKQLAELLDQQIFPHLHADQSLHLALERMGSSGLTLVPVVSRANVHGLEGILLRRDVLDSYGIDPDDDGE